MYTQKQVDRMARKLKRFEDTLDAMLFQKVAHIGAKAYETKDRLYEIPDDSLLEDAPEGYTWGGDETFCWFKTSFTVPKELNGKDIFIMPHTMGYETLLWVNGKPFGTFNTKIVFTGHGNHWCNLLMQKAKAGEKIDIALEVYSGHYYMGTQPLDKRQYIDFKYEFKGIDICVKDAEINDFYFDLKTVNELYEVLPDDSFRKGQIANEMLEMHKVLYYSYEDTDDATFRKALKAAKPYLKNILSVKNGPEAPAAGILGHSHMDTAWLWKSTETIKKCARTYSNQMALMAQYPEYNFVQSSAAHGNMILQHYPALFEDIKKRVKEGRYEPNGGVWVECDCNITSGESMVRQFLWGQRFTRKHFNFTSNTFWLPDTFGYSAAIPQIMKGCGVDYFCTTKLDWNDTNVFPYDTFIWEGLDGTKVFTHFNRTHCWPAPKALNELVTKDRYPGSSIKEKGVTNKRLIVYGFGDGGGGPQFEMIEMARRVKDVNGCPKTENTTVGKFMQDLEKEAKNPSTYKGELYLELHRGTLTNQHNIKHNNRKSELALRDVEFLTVSNAVKAGETAKDEAIHPLWETLLLNQFHDILPGTCIPSAHKLSLEQTNALLKEAAKLKKDLTKGKGTVVNVTNTLSFDRCDPIFIECKEGMVADLDCKQQTYKNIDGKNVLILSGVTVPAFSTLKIKLVKGEANGKSAFKKTAKTLETPFAKVKFDSKNYIASFYDKALNRDLKGDGYDLGTLIIAEDLPSDWDNWDVDVDLQVKFKDESKLLSSEVISNGEVAYIIRNTYSVSAKSTVTQDVIFFADSKEVRYDTLMDWNDDHRFMKAAFDTSLQSDFARFEIQYGNVLRPTTRNNSLEKAKFEVVNHKYTDLSETRCGVAILNDSKYAITAEGGKLRLSLHKGGNRPDFTGDHGKHRTVYSFLPHEGAFSAENVIRPAYELNIPVVQGKGDYEAIQLVKPECANIIVESIKPCEDNEKAFIVRMYEAEGAYTNCPVAVFDGAKKVEETNMLEEVKAEADMSNVVFTPFQIKTFKITY